MPISYDNYVVKYSDSFIRIMVAESYANRIRIFAEKIVEAKQKESHHQIDNRKEVKRFTTGLLGEAALEKLLGISIIDWTIGTSNIYHKPDIPGYSVGIKTVEKYKFPIIFKKNYYPQIICVTSTTIENLVFVCGLATPDILNKYQSDDLILDRRLRSRGTKTGFYGFEHLSPITSLTDIEIYKKEGN